MGKADALERLLAGASGAFTIDPFVAFTLAEWGSDPDRIISRILASVPALVFIVRSSTIAEGFQGSAAGMYGSVAGVGRKRAELRSAITTVIATYSRGERLASPTDQVIVQEQVTNVQLAGVVTTLDDNALPYVTISYDRSGRTNAVTQGERTSTVRIRRGCAPPRRWSRVVHAVEEVCRVLRKADLVMEFALDESGVVHVFQAWSRGRRPLVSEEEVGQREECVAAEYDRIGTPILSTMSDWNPAEILGRQPSPLAISAYQELVTRSVWSRARATLGYHEQPGDLLVVLDGRPYVSVEQSLRSFTPASLSEDARRVVVASQLRTLERRPELHDKLEWQVAITTAVLWDDPRFHSLPEPARSELKAALSSLTNVALASHLNPSASDRHVSKIARARAELKAAPLTPDTLSRTLGALIAHGTMPFSVHARLAFMLRELVAQGVLAGALPRGAVDLCLRHTHTGAAALNDALRGILTGSVSREWFLRRFGHLRPQSYEIEAQRYDDDGVLDLLLSRTRLYPGRAALDIPDYPEADAFTDLLSSAGVTLDGASIMRALATEMSERERLKFVFTGLLSDLLESIAALGAANGRSRSAMAERSLSSLFGAGLGERIRAWQLPLPDVLTPSISLSSFEIGEGEPTFAGLGSFGGRPVVVHRDLMPTDTLAGCVVLMESAEPGCDWILSTGLGALVTAYGGTASHMAIRAAEIGIPTAVGCGVEMLSQLQHAARVVVDADRKLLTIGV